MFLIFQSLIFQNCYNNKKQIGNKLLKITQLFKFYPQQEKSLSLVGDSLYIVLVLIIRLRNIP